MSTAKPPLLSRALPAWLQALPLALVFAVFFVVPLALTVMVSFWDYTEYALVPAFTLRSYSEMFEGCYDRLPDLCVTLKTYLSTLKFCLIVWLVTLVTGFFIAYFLAFHVRSLTWQIALFLLCTVPFWTSNVIRTISWIPLLGRNGLVNSTLIKLHLIDTPIEWLIFSDFSVIVALVHLYTLFMIVPIFNAMARIDPSLLEAATDGGASRWGVVWNVVLPLSKTGIALGSILVFTQVMGDFFVVKAMSGGQSASIVSALATEIQAMQYPPAAANSVVLVIFVAIMVALMMRVVDVRKELVK